MQFIIDSLSKSYSKKEVLKKVSFTFESGKIYGLLGRNGAGKTTLFNCLNGDIPRDGGDFWFSEAGARRAVRPDDIGYVLSTPAVPEFLDRVDLENRAVYVRHIPGMFDQPLNGDEE